MTDDYRSYTFTLGESPKRNYKGIRAPVSQGKVFAFDALDKYLPIVLSIIKECNLQNDGSRLDGMQLVIEAAKHVKLSELMQQGDKILSNQATGIVACEDNSPKSFALSNQKQFDEWFEMHPGDIMEVYAYAIWKTVEPFTSSFMETIKASMKEKASQEQEAI